MIDNIKRSDKKVQWHPKLVDFNLGQYCLSPQA